MFSLGRRFFNLLRLGGFFNNFTRLSDLDRCGLGSGFNWSFRGRRFDRGFRLDLLGDKWSLLVMRDVLLRGKSHYREFAASEEHIATNILADRLARLEAGIVSVHSWTRS